MKILGYFFNVSSLDRYNRFHPLHREHVVANGEALTMNAVVGPPMSAEDEDRRYQQMC